MNLHKRHMQTSKVRRSPYEKGKTEETAGNISLLLEERFIGVHVLCNSMEQPFGHPEALPEHVWREGITRHKINPAWATHGRRIYFGEMWQDQAVVPNAFSSLQLMLSIQHPSKSPHLLQRPWFHSHGQSFNSATNHHNTLAPPLVHLHGNQGHMTILQLFLEHLQPQLPNFTSYTSVDGSANSDWSASISPCPHPSSSNVRPLKSIRPMQHDKHLHICNLNIPITNIYRVVASFIIT